MKRSVGYALVLLAASAMAAREALARGPQTSGVALFLRSGSGAAPARSGQGYLGVGLRDVAADRVAALKLKEARGAEIVLVDHDAPAGKAGLREHDVILQMNGQEIEGEMQIRRMLHESPPGTTIVLLISRDGQPMTVTTQMADQEEVEHQAWEQHLAASGPQNGPQTQGTDSDPSVGAAGLTPPVRGGNSFLGPMPLDASSSGAMLETLSAQLAEYFGAPGGVGLLVRSVAANSPAALAGMRAGDVVRSVNGRAVSNSADWGHAIRESRGRPVTVVVLRDKKEQTLTLTPDAKKRSRLDGPLVADPVRIALVPLEFHGSPSA